MVVHVEILVIELRYITNDFVKCLICLSLPIRYVVHCLPLGAYTSVTSYIGETNPGSVQM